MRLTVFRMTVGRWMTVTAVVAILFGCDRLVKSQGPIPRTRGGAMHFQGP